MRTITLEFEDLYEVELFLDMIDNKHYHVNKERLQVTGKLEEKEIEFAKSAFAATVHAVQRPGHGSQ
ncbi:MAG: hypothetical protein EOO06_21120 [Chitinophagaceae bacterium]|nr:MAG: hypothetical protein EOO06_21120 [Chitinophagaceae bacterium]